MKDEILVAPSGDHLVEEAGATSPRRTEFALQEAPHGGSTQPAKGARVCPRPDGSARRHEARSAYGGQDRTAP